MEPEGLLLKYILNINGNYYCKNYLIIHQIVKLEVLLIRTTD